MGGRAGHVVRAVPGRTGRRTGEHDMSSSSSSSSATKRDKEVAAAQGGLRRRDDNLSRCLGWIRGDLREAKTCQVKQANEQLGCSHAL